MRNIILCDDKTVGAQLLPLTFTRPVSEILCGAMTVRERWQRLLPGLYSYDTADYLQEKYPATVTGDDDLSIASHIIPDGNIACAAAALQQGQALVLADGTVAAWCGDRSKAKPVPYTAEPNMIRHLHDIFTLNHTQIASDFDIITDGRKSQALSDSCTVIGPRESIFIEEGATVEGAFLNTTNGPIYIGAHAEVMEGSCLRGPIAIMDHAAVNMGSKVYGGTTIGAYSKIGGEVNNVVMHPYSNKAHDGFLGNAVIGSWCNLGAGCVASNLKNDYTEIKLWDYSKRRFLRTGLQFCGLIMGDHSKAGINTMFNTATVVGVGVNIHGTGFPRNFVASFTEGSAAGFADVPQSKFFQIAERVMARRNVELTDADRRLYATLYEITETYK